MAGTSAARRTKSRGSAIYGSALFMIVLGYYWVTLSPFPNLGLASAADPWAGSSNLLNQAVAILLFGLLASFALRHPLGREVARPHGLLLAVLAWFALASLFAPDPATALRRVVMAAMVCISASIFLLLPRDERQFGKLLGIALLALLALAYYGVIFLPLVSIHQETDVVEPLLAGMWRGFYAHKNTTAEAMAFTVFGGLFVCARWSKLIGAALIGLALFFLYKTGGKTSLAMVPATLVAAWAFGRWPNLRYPLVLGGLGLFNFVAVGSAVWPPLQSLVSSLGIDATFTDRVDIWRLAFSAIREHPLTGYGLQSFWQTDALVYGGGTLETWAVTAANAHNAYLECMINAGIPGLALVVLWLVVWPIKDVARAEATMNDPALTRLFLQVWLYGIFAACLESSFFGNSGPVWFTILVGVFGLSYQARAQVVPGVASEGRLVHA